MTNDSQLSLRYSESQTDIPDLEQEISLILEELTQQGSDAYQAAVDAGLDPDLLTSATVNIDEKTMGFGPVALLIVVAAPVATHIVNKFWDDVVEPRINKRLGARALGHREEDADEDEDPHVTDEQV